MEKNQSTYYIEAVKPHIQGYVEQVKKAFGLDLNELPLPKGTLKRALAEYRAELAQMANEIYDWEYRKHKEAAEAALNAAVSIVKSPDPEQDSVLHSMREMLLKVDRAKQKFFSSVYSGKDVLFSHM